MNVQRGKYDMDPDDLAAAKRARARFPDAPLLSMRIGYPAAYRIAAWCWIRSLHRAMPRIAPSSTGARASYSVDVNVLLYASDQTSPRMTDIPSTRWAFAQQAQAEPSGRATKEIRWCAWPERA
jgi:hypothetical protein